MDHSKLRHRYGRALIRTAWGLEIVAAAIGLFIALATAFATHAEILAERPQIGPADWMTIFIGALPFVMVAIVELMKIPLATAFYLSEARLWRLTFFVALVLLIGITFETMLNGFQRQYESRVYLITELRTELTSLDDEIVEAGRRISDLTTVTVAGVRDGRSREISQIRATESAKLDEIGRRIVEQRALLGQTATTTQRDEIDRLRAQVDRLNQGMSNEVEALTSSYDSERERDESAIQNERDILNERIRRLDDQIAEGRRQLAQELERCAGDLLCFRAEEIRTQYAEQEALIVAEKERLSTDLAERSGLASRTTRRNDLEQRIAAVRSRYNARIDGLESRLQSLVQETDNRESRSAEKVDAVVVQLQVQRQDVEAEAERAIAAIDERYRLRLEEVEDREDRISQLQGEIAERQLRKNELRKEINFRAKNNQIYQIAALWFGKESPVDVTKEELKFISTIWFGSLALVVALIGTVLALAGLVLQFHDRQRPASLARAVLASVRRAAIEFRLWLRRHPVRTRIETVVREVPVEKVVLRDVPKEVVIKELVYVPLYTNDPELLNIDHGIASKGLPTRRDDYE